MSESKFKLWPSWNRMCLFGRIYLTPCIGILIVSKNVKCECQFWTRAELGRPELGARVWSPCKRAEGEFCGPSASHRHLKLRTRVLLGDDWTQEGALALNAHYDEKHSSCWICVQGSWAQLISCQTLLCEVGKDGPDPYLWDSRLAGWQASLSPASWDGCSWLRLLLFPCLSALRAPWAVLPAVCHLGQPRSELPSEPLQTEGQTAVALLQMSRFSLQIGSFCFLLLLP